MRIFGLFKMARLGRFTQFLQRLNMDMQTKALLQIAKSLLIMLLFFNLQACAWFAVVRVWGEELKDGFT